MDNWNVNKDTELFFSVSSKPGDFGSTLYNAAFQELGIDAIYKPLKLQHLNDFKSLMEALQTIGASGLSVSMPFKKIAKTLSWTNHNDAFQIGNCNTLTLKDGTICGDNTDWTGFSIACKEVINKSKGAIIYGTGAVSDSIIYALDKKRIPFRRINRKDVYLLSKDSERDYSDFLINATPIGMQGIEDTVFTKDIVSKYKYVFDVVVNKEPTNLIKLANEHCKLSISGIVMSLHQLCRQFSIYTQKESPMELFIELLKEKYNVKL